MTRSLYLLASATALFACVGAHAETPALNLGQPAFQTTQALGGEEPLPAEEAFKVEALALDANNLLVRFTMPDGYYLYRDRTQFTLEPSADTEITPDWPGAVAHNDEHFGPVAVFYGEIDVPVKLSEASAKGENALMVKMQGCKEDSVCYPPMRRRLEF